MRPYPPSLLKLTTDLSIAVAVGSSIQVAMFVIPVVQLLAWCISKPMTMLFDPFEAVVLFFSVLIVNQTLADGRSNWMEGVVLMLLYLLIAIAFWCEYRRRARSARRLGQETDWKRAKDDTAHAGVCRGQAMARILVPG